jgi:hypothetical protein
MLSNNTFSLIKGSNELARSDAYPAAMWISNPNNAINNISIAGSEGYGFWFDIKSSVLGPFSTNNICPDGVHPQDFIDNNAHSIKLAALRITGQMIPRLHPCD